MEKRESFAHELCEIFVKQGVMGAAEGRAMQRSFKGSDKENFDDFLLEEGLVEEKALLRALGEYYQLPPVDVVGYFFDTLLLRNFPKDFLLSRKIIPLEEDQDILTVVASDPTNPELLPEIGKYTSCDIQYRIGLGRDIEDAVKEFYDTSLTDLPDDEQVLEDEMIENEKYHDLLKDDDEDTIATIDREETEE
jgi:hypothetical protein